MFGSTVIVFRETLEAALIIGILLAAVGTAARAKRWIAGGVVAGLAGAGIVALFAETIASSLAGVGQEIFNASVLLAATAMLGWHHVWMKSHGRQLSVELRATGASVSSGAASFTALLMVVALAVMREGSEVVLFLYGIALGGADGRGILFGGLLGLAGGVAVGALTYTGLARIPQRQLFAITGWLLTLLAAGMAAQAAGYLTQAGLIPALADPLWDTSNLVSEHRPLGQLLHVLIGYNERPSGVQMLFFALTVIAIVALSIRVERRMPKLRAANVSTLSVVGAAALLVSSLFYGQTAHAAHKVYSPIVEEGENAIELRGHINFDSDDTVNHAQQFKAEFEHAVTARWLTEIVGEFEKFPDESLKTTAIEWENIFQLTEQGAHWMDVGVLTEYSRELKGEVKNKIALGALLEKQMGKQAVNFNLIAEHELGGEHATDLAYAARWRWRMSQALEPAIELHGELGDVDHFESFSDQEHSMGPGLLGSVVLSPGSKLRYEAAYLVGISRAAPNGTLRMQLEYEFR